MFRAAVVYSVLLRVKKSKLVVGDPPLLIKIEPGEEEAMTIVVLKAYSNIDGVRLCTYREIPVLAANRPIITE